MAVGDEALILDLLLGSGCDESPARRYEIEAYAMSAPLSGRRAVCPVIQVSLQMSLKSILRHEPVSITQGKLVTGSLLAGMPTLYYTCFDSILR